MPRHTIYLFACAFGVGVVLANGCEGTKGGSSGPGGPGGSSGGTGGSATGGAGSGGAGASGAGGRSSGGRGGGAGQGTGGDGGGPGSGGAATGGAATGGAGGTGASSPGGSGAGGASGAGGIGGVAGLSYSGCSFLGDIDRVVVGKRDTGRNLCVVVVFSNGTNTSQVVLPQSWRVESAFAFSPATACATRGPPANSYSATSETGTASWIAGPSWPYGSASVDVVLAFPPGGAGTMTNEAIHATSVDVSGPCL